MKFDNKQQKGKLKSTTVSFSDNSRRGVGTTQRIPSHNFTNFHNFLRLTLIQSSHFSLFSLQCHLGPYFCLSIPLPKEFSLIIINEKIQGKKKTFEVSNNKERAELYPKANAQSSELSKSRCKHSRQFGWHVSVTFLRRIKVTTSHFKRKDQFFSSAVAAALPITIFTRANSCLHGCPSPYENVRLWKGARHLFRFTSLFHLEWFGLQKTFKGHLVHSPCNEQGTSTRSGYSEPRPT